ncbi:hypothetical protein ACFE04_028966 [Oxalis oulophora]
MTGFTIVPPSLQQSVYFNFSIQQGYIPARSSCRIRSGFASRRWLRLNSASYSRWSRFDSFSARCSITDTDVQLHQYAANDEISEDLSRVESFSARCSITNTDVQLHQYSTNDEISEDLSRVEIDCPVQIVHLNSDILETDSLSLLTEATDLDTILTKLPVLSEEEQNALAATPVHPAALQAFYASCLAGNVVEQLWNFAWPSAIAMLHPSLLPVATMGFVTKIVMIIGGPLIGNLMDHSPRLPAYISLNIIQAAAQLLSAAMIIHAHTVHSSPSTSMLLQPWFIALVFAGAIERLSGVALGVANERDWVVLFPVLWPLSHLAPCTEVLQNITSVSLNFTSATQRGPSVNKVTWQLTLAGINRPIALAEANAVLSRIDLLCEISISKRSIVALLFPQPHGIAGASVFGILLSNYDPVTCLKFAAALMIGSLPVMISLTWLTNKLSTGVLDRAKVCQTCCRASDEEAQGHADSIVDIGLKAIKLGWKEYIQQPVLPASLAYVLLFFNVVLTPGSLMTAFLTQRGLNPSVIGGFSGLCAFMGVVATFLSAYLVRRLGILKAGAAGLILQASLLTLAVGVYCSGSLSQQNPILFFLCLIVLSRLGHMSYDVVGAQILQTGIPSSKANLIGTTEISVASLAECLMLGVVMVANETSHFGFLAVLSLLSVVGAAWMFCRWLMNPTEEQRNLFSFDPRF